MHGRGPGNPPFGAVWKLGQVRVANFAVFAATTTPVGTAGSHCSASGGQFTSRPGLAAPLDAGDPEPESLVKPVSPTPRTSCCPDPALQH